MLADATTNWAARVRLPCDRVPQPEVCGLAGGREGTLSFRFAVAQTTRGKPFTLKPAERGADLEIVFRGGAPVHLNARDVLHPTGTETGTVPADATTAEVCLVMGVPTAFTYRAG